MKSAPTTRLLVASVLALTAAWVAPARAAVLSQPANMTVNEGATADQVLNATDPDGDPLAFSKVSGPTYATVTTTTPGAGTATGNLHLAPGFSDSGTATVSILVSDASTSDGKSLTVTVAQFNRAPVLTQPANMLVEPGFTADQIITGSDADGDALTFSKVSGPTFATVTTTTINPPRGNIHLAPGFSELFGTSSATVNTSDGVLADSKSFTITVGQCHGAPVLAQPGNMTVNEGTTANQGITATDACGTPLTFFKAAGPTFMTVTTTTPGTGTGTGNIQLAPSFSDQGTYSATVSATDGSLSDSKSLTITVNVSDPAPILAQPANMTVDEGGTANQTLTATAADGTALTFSLVSGPTYVTVTTLFPGTGTGTGNVHLAPGFVDSGTTAATVRVSNGSSSDQKSFTITVNNVNRQPVLAQPANMTVFEGATADQTLSASDPDGDPLTFSKVAGPTFMAVTTTNATTGNVHLAAGFLDNGTYTATVRVSDNGSPVLANDKSFTITIGSGCRTILVQPANMTVSEGATADQILAGSDPDGRPQTFTKVSGPIFMTVSTLSAHTGLVHLAPGFSDAGTYTAVVRATNDCFATDSKSLTITVIEEHRCPVANPGGPYTGVVGAPVAFNGTGSSDPDGDGLSYAWDFDASDGITVDATGPTPSHAYPVPGTFTVTLTVTETTSPFCSNTATTTATILSACDATVFNGYDVIRLASGKPTWFAFVQPVNECYSNADVVVSSFVLKYAGRQIPADISKTAVIGDKNGDGIQEIRVTFSKQNLRTLFTGTGLGNGHNLVDVTIEANLATGGALQGTTQVDVFNNGDFSAASVSPNPLNPSATLTFTTSRQGFAKIELFDIAGRLVRTILDEPTLAAGTHEVKIEGRGQRGETLASGVYFIRGVSADGKFTKAIAILK